MGQFQLRLTTRGTQPVAEAASRPPSPQNQSMRVGMSVVVYKANISYKAFLSPNGFHPTCHCSRVVIPSTRVTYVVVYVYASDLPVELALSKNTQKSACAGVCNGRACSLSIAIDTDD